MSKRRARAAAASSARARATLHENLSSRNALIQPFAPGRTWFLRVSPCPSATVSTAFLLGLSCVLIVRRVVFPAGRSSRPRNVLGQNFWGLRQLKLFLLDVQPQHPASAQPGGTHSDHAMSFCGGARCGRGPRPRLFTRGGSPSFFRWCATPPAGVLCAAPFNSGFVRRRWRQPLQ